MHSALHARLLVALAVVGAVAGAGAISGCTRAPAGDRASGSIGLGLDLSAGVVLTEATYTITGPGGYRRSTTVPLGNTPRVATLIGGTPPGTSYVLSISGLASDGKSICTGTSEPFDVIAGETTRVNLRLECREPERTGNIQVGGVANYCPVIDSISLGVTQAAMGQTILLASATHDRNNAPGPISYRWSATSGTFGNPHAPAPAFTCNVIGPVTITLAITDGDCGDSRSATLTCTVPPPDAGAVALPDASAPDAGAAPVGDPCLACVTASANPACQVRYHDCVTLPGEAAEGPAAGSPRSGLCLDVLTCVHTTRCDRGPGGLRDCFCGVGVDEIACQTSATGVCRAAFHAAGESNDHGNVLTRMRDATFALGAASELIRECEEKPAPLCGPACGF